MVHLTSGVKITPTNGYRLLRSKSSSRSVLETDDDTFNYKQWLDDNARTLLHWSRQGELQDSAPSLHSAKRADVEATIKEQEALILALQGRAEPELEQIEISERRIAKCKAIIAPIRLLPPELLRRVLCSRPKPVFPQSTKALWAWMRVSLLWYQIAQSTPELFSSMVLSSQGIPPRQVHPNCFDSWIANAKSHPLDIELDICHSAKRIIQGILCRAEQWRTFELYMDQEHWTPPFFEAVHSFSGTPYEPNFGEALRRAKQLETLTLKTSGVFGGISPEAFACGDSEPILLSRLATLNLHGWCCFLPRMSLPSITSFSANLVAFRNQAHLESTLSMMPGLHTLAIRNCHVPGSLEDTSRLPIFPRLKQTSFHMFNQPPSFVPLYVKIIQCSPNLTTLSTHITFFPPFPWPVVPQLKTFVLVVDFAAPRLDLMTSTSFKRMGEWWLSHKEMRFITFEMKAGKLRNDYQISVDFLTSLVTTLTHSSPPHRPCPLLRSVTFDFAHPPRDLAWKQAVLDLSRQRGHTDEEFGSDDSLPRQPNGFLIFIKGRDKGPKKNLAGADYDELRRWFGSVKRDRWIEAPSPD